MKKLCSLFVAFLVFFGTIENSIAENIMNPPLVDPIEKPEEPTEIPTVQTGEIRINEVNANPESGEEWIEIVLLTDKERSLSGCTVSDALGIIYTFPEDTIIAPGEFLLVSGWSSKLNNSGDSVTLKNSQEEEITEKVEFPALDKGETWAFDGSGYQKTTLPTPEAENLFPVPEEDPEEGDIPEETEPESPLPETGEIIISEIVSNPEDGQEEWIELWSSASDIRSLSGLTLSDEVGKIYSFSAEDTISPDEYLVVSGWGSKLNNTGDSLFLRNIADETIAEVVSFPALEKGESWLPEENAKGIPTPGEENELLPEDKPEEPEDIILPPDLGGILPPQIGEIIISEIMSSPTDSDEWVELFSSASDTRHLGGMVFADDIGDFFTIPIGTVIDPEEYLVISGWSSKLNNSGDSLTIKDQDGNEMIPKVVFPSLNKGVSWAWDGKDFTFTGSPTPNEQNMITDPASSSGSSSSSGSMGKSSLVKTAASMPSVGSEEIELIISEVMFRGKEEDFIELYCQKCDTDLGGIRVADDDLIFEFPKNTEIRTGEYIVIHFDKEEEQQDFPDDDVYHFWGEKTGLTGTDETIFIIDSRGNVEDALCIADRSGNFSPGEQEDIIHLIHQKALKSTHPLSEEICFDSRKLKTDVSLAFTGKKTGFASHDYFWTDEPTSGTKNPRSPQRVDFEALVIDSALRFSEEQIGIIIKNTSPTPVRLHDFSLQHGEDIFPLPEETLFAGDTKVVPFTYSSASIIAIIDHWEDIVFSADDLPIDPFLEGVGPVVLSEFLPNPKGEDAENEFVEIRCIQEICRSEDIVFLVNGEPVSLPSGKWQNGEYILLSDVSLRNTDLTGEIFNIPSKTKETITIASAKDGKSYSRFGEDWIWASPSPEKQNIPEETSSFSDIDKDGIPDVYEFVLHLDPFAADKKVSSGYKLFSSYVKRGSKLEILEEEDGIRISGKTLPNAKVVVMLHSEKKTFTASTDEKGLFEIQAFPDIEPGFHQADMIISTKEDIFIERGKAQVNLKKNPQGDWLKNVEISMVLPNPDGKDSQKEMVIIKNLEEKSGKMRGFFLSNGKTQKHISDLSFAPGQTKVLKGRDIPQLKNTSGKIELIDTKGDVLQTISWSKAKEGQWFGPQAPQYTPKRSSSSQKKRSLSRTPEEQVPEPVMTQAQGEFAYIENGIFALRDEKNHLILYRINSDILSESTLQAYLRPGQKIILTLQDGLVVQVEVVPVPVHNLPSEPIPQRDFFFILVLLLAILTATISPLAFRLLVIRKTD